MTDYEKGLESVKNVPHVYLGQEVKTPIGKGIIVHLKMEHNGLFIEPYKSTAVVWFSSMDPKEHWINKEFKLSELEINFRKDKLQKIKDNYGCMGS